jgi:hypothetical protein
VTVDSTWVPAANDDSTDLTDNNESLNIEDLDMKDAGGDQDPETDSAKRRHSTQTQSSMNKKQKPNGKGGKHGGGAKGWSSTQGVLN